MWRGNIRILNAYLIDNMLPRPGHLFRLVDDADERHAEIGVFRIITMTHTHGPYRAVLAHSVYGEFAEPSCCIRTSDVQASEMYDKSGSVVYRQTGPAKAAGPAVVTGTEAWKRIEVFAKELGHSGIGEEHPARALLDGIVMELDNLSRTINAIASSNGPSGDGQ